MVNFSILTITDSRSEEEDLSGDAIANLVIKSGNKVKQRRIVKNNIEEIRSAVKELKCNILITIGGTGISSRDITVEAIKPMLDKELPGFGELFRSLSYGQIKTSTIMSRAFAGTIGKKVIISLPGSIKACKLAIGEIVLKECDHMLREINK